ncbi:hypothetical protein [Caudoviricetes sp.]|nr:hypothetical protein [Caudoviricetes sp.]
MSALRELVEMGESQEAIDKTAIVNDWLMQWKFRVRVNDGKLISEGIEFSDAHIVCLMKKDLGDIIGYTGKKLDLFLKSALFGLKQCTKEAKIKPT